jgi:hypothetical protein
MTDWPGLRGGGLLPPLLLAAPNGGDGAGVALSREGLPR